MTRLAKPHHALGYLGRALVAEKEATASFQEVGNVLDIEPKVVEEDFEDMENGVRTCHLKLRELAVEAHVLFVSANRRRYTPSGACCPVHEWYACAGGSASPRQAGSQSDNKHSP